MKISENFVFRLMKVNCVADAQYLYSRHSRPVIILLNSAWKSSSKSFFNQKSALESDMNILNNLPPIFAAAVAAAEDQRIFESNSTSLTMISFTLTLISVFCHNDFSYYLAMISLFLWQWFPFSNIQIPTHSQPVSPSQSDKGLNKQYSVHVSDFDRSNKSSQ